MGWIAEPGDNGIGGSYIPPLSVEIQGSNKLLEVDIFCKFYFLCCIPVANFLLHFPRLSRDHNRPHCE